MKLTVFSRLIASIYFYEEKSKLDKTYMLKYLGLFLFVFFTSSPCRAENTLHFLAYGDIAEKYDSVFRGGDRQADLERADFFWKTVTKSLGYKYNNIICDSKGFTSKHMVEDINGLNIAPNDIIVVYYTGHGSNSGFDNFPRLAFKYEIDTGIKVSQLKSLLDEKTGAKNIFIIADCCNSILSGGDGQKSFTDEPITIMLKQQIKVIFDKIKNKGYILCSASPGQESWSFTDCTRECGSIWAMEFYKTLFTTAQYYNGESFDLILEKVDFRLSLLLKRYDKIQMPYHEPPYDLKP